MIDMQMISELVGTHHQRQHQIADDPITALHLDSTKTTTDFEAVGLGIAHMHNGNQKAMKAIKGRHGEPTIYISEANVSANLGTWNAGNIIATLTEFVSSVKTAM